MSRIKQADSTEYPSLDDEFLHPLSKILRYIKAMVNDTKFPDIAEMFRQLQQLKEYNLNFAELIYALREVECVKHEFPASMIAQLAEKAKRLPVAEILGASFAAELFHTQKMDKAIECHTKSLKGLMPIVPIEVRLKFEDSAWLHDKNGILYWPLDDIAHLIDLNKTGKEVPGLEMHCWNAVLTIVYLAMMNHSPITEIIPMIDNRFRHLIEACSRVLDELNKNDLNPPIALTPEGQKLQLVHMPAIKSPNDALGKVALGKVALVRQSEILVEFADQLLPGLYPTPSNVSYEWKLTKLKVTIDQWLYNRIRKTIVSTVDERNLWFCVFDHVSHCLINYLSTMMNEKQLKALGKFFLHVFGELIGETMQLFEHQSLGEMLDRAIFRTVQLLETLDMPIAVETNPLCLIPKVRRMLKNTPEGRKRSFSVKDQPGAWITDKDSAEMIVISDDEIEFKQTPKRAKEDSNSNEEIVQDLEFNFTQVNRMAWGVNFFTGRLYDVEKLSGSGRLSDDAETTWIDAEWSDGDLVFFNEAQVIIPSKEGNLLFRLSGSGRLSCDDYSLQGQLGFSYNQLLFNSKWNVSHKVRELILNNTFHYFDEPFARQDYGAWLQILHDRREHTYTSLEAARDIQFLGAILRNWRPRENLDMLHYIQGAASAGMSAELITASSRLCPYEKTYASIMEHSDLRRLFKPPIPFSLLLEIRETCAETPERHRDQVLLSAFQGGSQMSSIGRMLLQEVRDEAMIYLRPSAVNEMMRIATFAKDDMQIFQALWMALANSLVKLSLYKEQPAAGERVISPNWATAIHHLFAQRNAFADLSGIPKLDLVFLDTGEVLQLFDAIDSKWPPTVFCAFKQLEFAFKAVKGLFPMPVKRAAVLDEIDSTLRFVDSHKAKVVVFECRLLLATLRYVMRTIEERYVPKVLVQGYRNLILAILKRANDFIDVKAKDPTMALAAYSKNATAFMAYIVRFQKKWSDESLKQMTSHVAAKVDEPSKWPIVFQAILK